MVEVTRHSFGHAAGARIPCGPDHTLEAGAPSRRYAPSPLNPHGAAFHKFTVGDIEIYQIFDGAASRDLPADFVANATIEDINAALKANGFQEDKIANAYTITIARIGGRLVMFDSGNGEGGQPGSGHLQENMRAAGLDPKDLSAIIVTHLHPDHIFGLMTKSNEQVYPTLDILVPQTEYDFWTAPDTISQLPKARVALAQRIQATFPTWKNISHYAAGEDVLPGIRAIATPGHTPGHTSLLLSSGGHQVLVTADVTNVPVFNMHHPDWHIAPDQDPHLAAKTRHQVLGQAAADKMICTGYHWGMPGAGTIEKHGDGYALVPVTMG